MSIPILREGIWNEHPYTHRKVGGMNIPPLREGRRNEHPYTHRKAGGMNISSLISEPDVKCPPLMLIIHEKCTKLARNVPPPPYANHS